MIIMMVHVTILKLSFTILCFSVGSNEKDILLSLTIKGDCKYEYEDCKVLSQTSVYLICRVWCLAIRNSAGSFPNLQYISNVVCNPRDLQMLQCFHSIEDSSLIQHRRNLWIFCCLWWFIYGLGNLQSDQTGNDWMFRITAEA